MRPKDFRPRVRENDERFVVDRRQAPRGTASSTARCTPTPIAPASSIHTNFLRFFERGRTSLMRDIGYPYKQVEDAGTVLPGRRLAVTFHRPLHYDGPSVDPHPPRDSERVRVTFGT